MIDNSYFSWASSRLWKTVHCRVCVCVFKNILKHTISGVHRQQCHPMREYCRSTESSSAIYRPRHGRKGAPRCRQSTSNDHCSDNWNTFEQVNVVNISNLNKSYVGSHIQIGHNRVYSAQNQVSENWTIPAHFEWNSDTNGKFRRMLHQDWH